MEGAEGAEGAESPYLERWLRHQESFRETGVLVKVPLDTLKFQDFRSFPDFVLDFRSFPDFALDLRSFPDFVLDLALALVQVLDLLHNQSRSLDM